MPHIERAWKRAFDPDFDVENQEVETKTGLTKKQRDWARRVYDRDGDGLAECFWLLYSEKRGWYFCESRSCKKNIQIHHIIPQGFSKRVLESDPDRPRNLIAIGAHHHIGLGYGGALDWRNELVPVIHPDMEYARRNYRSMGKRSYEMVFAGRRTQTSKYDTYWNTDFDSMLQQIAEEWVGKYLSLHPDDPFPANERNHSRVHG